MSKTRNVSLLAGAAVTLGAFGNAYAVEGQDQAYTSADEVRAIVANMMADTDTRSSMMNQGGGGGYDDGFYLADSSGNFRLNFRGLIQFRYFLNFRDAGSEQNPDSDFDSGFQNTRTRLGFDGYVINPNLFYDVEGLFQYYGGGNESFNGDLSGGNFQLQRAYVGYRWDNGFHARWGQFRLQYEREENVLPEYQLAADRSLQGYYFGQGDVQGIELGYSAEDFRIFAAFTDGFRSDNTDWPGGETVSAVYDPFTGDLLAVNPPTSAWASGESDVSFTARAEIRFAGTWEQFEDFTSMPGSEFGAMLGVAGTVQWTDSDRVSGGANTGDVAYWGWTADLSLEGDGWNFFVAGNGGYTQIDSLITNNITGNTEDYQPDNYGITVQGGIFIPETDWEFFARYDVIFFDTGEQKGLVSDRDSFNTVTFGTNWYWSGHAAKFTFDVQWFIDKTNPLVPSNSKVGYISNDADNSFTLRFQFQLMF
jgi:hypothetical protein